tara:strand:+ start:385 stop:534 length:150 start_codon:yes stop_codon:yes gene_type:complete
MVVVVWQEQELQMKQVVEVVELQLLELMVVTHLTQEELVVTAVLELRHL